MPNRKAAPHPAALDKAFSLAQGSPFLRALVAFLLVPASAAVAWAVCTGRYRCPQAALFHVPCLACGSTRAVLLLCRGDVLGALRLHAIAPFAALLTIALVLRAAWLIATDGTVRALGDGPVGGTLARAGLVIVALEIGLYTARWFGMFGGPVPV
jgi:hypothetical protein